MKETEIQLLVEKQREFFLSGKTLPLEYRINALKLLKKAIIENENKISEAIRKDIGKSNIEGFMCEIGLVLSEISYMLSHIRRFAKDKTVYTNLAQFASRSYVKSVPYGVTLIISPWNYPFLLSIEPLVDALAAGNTAIIKPSEYSSATSEVIAELISNIFPREYVAVVTGGREENIYLLDQKFDYIFFTGSQAVGKYVMSKAADNLTPVTLELGGKSPCIVDESAKISLAAKRIVFGKFLNCGQTCVAPDYILCHSSIKDELISCIREEIKKQFGEKPLENQNYGKIINTKHFKRIIRLIDTQKIAWGGRYEEKSLRIEPTVLDNITFSDAVMKEEIFGPILPVLTYESLDDVISIVNKREKPLALYIFSENKKNIKKITTNCYYGGGCINDVVIHLATSSMGFGGVGESGMGAYHGKTGFDTFSHKKSIVDKKTFIDLPMRYQPYKSLSEKLIRMFLK
ncbi:aldehyde dehydrogenase [Clostridium sp. AL.422]|uniref:aldehyde dehydrogenase n=1 Tax=Clostridium TaxID=1485 RepID=UPI00293DEC67|nr:MULTISPECIES: aldehyde dehydrogenase [unclassified Clostridium]MDV4150766.1 aldehyde dehydrogenase [Clostridium sp. AL.422]